LISASRKSIAEISAKDLSFLKNSLTSSYVFTGLSSKAWMFFRPSTTGCTVGLRFEFGWYATKLVVGIPVGGDEMGGLSNLSLEKAYLDELGKRMIEPTSTH
jgi:hypothetical protein